MVSAQQNSRRRVRGFSALLLILGMAAASHGADIHREAVNALLWSGDSAAQFAARRALRLESLPPAAPPPSVSGPTYNAIDQFIVAKWESDHLPQATNPPPVCDDAAFARRVYLDVTGMIPTAAECEAFVNDLASDKRTKLVDTLLSRGRQYAEHWTTFWQDALASQSTVGGVATHGDYTDFIYQSFLQNKPYDLFVAELLDPTLPGYKKANVSDANGKTLLNGFIRNDNHNDTIQSAANTAQVFLATEMKCASCHNHFLNKEWPQKRFTSFAGLFTDKDLEVIRCEKPSGNFAAAAFPFDIPGAPTNVPSGTDQRLHYMTTLLIDPADPRFSEAIVNRLWRRFLGLGLLEPVDDFRADRTPSHPELLRWLADDFMRHDYDLKHTMRLILTSRTYQLRYDPALEDSFNSQKPDAPRYMRSPALRRVTAEEALDSLHRADKPAWDGPRLFRDDASTALTRALGRPPTRNTVSTGRGDDVAVVQSLEFLNGAELHDLVYDGGLASNLASKPENQKTLDELYWTVLSRPPNPAETRLGLDYLSANAPASETTTNKAQAWGDMMWALVVSPEFQYIR